MKAVGVGVRKKDAAALLSGKPVYTADIAPRDCLCVKLMRSPHAHAMIEEIDVSRAQSAPGVACVLTYRDVPQVRFTFVAPGLPLPTLNMSTPQSLPIITAKGIAPKR